jgi:hypothetical protein
MLHLCYYGFNLNGGCMKKLIIFKDLGARIKAYADKHCEGNFSLAVRELVRKGLEDE